MQYAAVQNLNLRIADIGTSRVVVAALSGERLAIGTISTGDGFIVILNPKVSGYGPLFALFARNSYTWEMEGDDYSRSIFEGIRAAVHHGTVLPIKIQGNDNFVGSGINDCQRLFHDEVEARACLFYSDSRKDYVVVSDLMWDRFSSLFRSRPTWGGDKKALGLRIGRPFEIEVKHSKKLHARLLDIQRKTISVSADLFAYPRH